jgi:hypothetical protein
MLTRFTLAILYIHGLKSERIGGYCIHPGLQPRYRIGSLPVAWRTPLTSRLRLLVCQNGVDHCSGNEHKPDADFNADVLLERGRTCHDCCPPSIFR